MTVARSWSRIVGWLADNHPATAALVNPPATAADVRYLQAAINRPLPADLVELLELATVRSTGRSEDRSSRRSTTSSR